MEQVCAWCGKTIKQPDGEESEITDGLISHGVCTSCAVHLRAQMGVPLMEYLDSFSIPVVVIDHDVVVCGANQPAQRLLQKDNMPPVTGRLCGDVFECVNAIQPGGCGGTIHCSACVIRNAVNDTFATGREHLDVPAPLKCAHDSAPPPPDMLISTWKAGDVVLLRVVEIGKR